MSAVVSIELVGVGSNRPTITARGCVPSLRRHAAPANRRASRAKGVGSILRSAVASPSPAFSESSARLLLPNPVGVGSKQEEAFAEVGIARFDRRKQVPFRIEPCAGKVPQNDGEGLFPDLGAVLQEDVGRSNVANDFDDAGPEPTGIRRARPWPCLGEWLAGKTGSDDMNSITERQAVKGSQIIPDRCFIQVALNRERGQSSSGICFPLHVTDGSVAISESETEPELEAADAGAEGDTCDGM